METTNTVTSDTYENPHTTSDRHRSRRKRRAAARAAARAASAQRKEERSAARAAARADRLNRAEAGAGSQLATQDATALAVRPARKIRRDRPRAEQSRGPKKSFWLQLEEILFKIERGARELRDVADSAASAIEFGRQALTEQQDNATTLKSRATRLHKTGSMLAQLVLGYRLFGLRTAFSSPERTAELWHKLHADNASRFTQTSLEQGGAFLKVGQLLSARADLLPEIWVRELATLQDAASPLSDEEARGVIERSLGAAHEASFASFDWKPLAAASIGQVHRARTVDGREVAVKLQRPGIASRIEDDLALLDITLDAMRSTLPNVDLDTIIREVRGHVRAEVDYAREAQLTYRAARFFEAYPGLTVPEPVLELCRPDILTTRFIEGRKITVVLDELYAAREAGDQNAHARLSELLGRLLQSYLRQMLELGTFQADPHPGNILVTADDELAILDFGCAAELSDETRRAYLDLMSAFFERDADKLAHCFDVLGFRTESGRADTLVTFMDALLGELAEAIQSGSVRWPDRAAIAARAQGLGKSLNADPVVTLPGHFVMIGRVLATLGGLFSHYRPDLDVTLHVLPVLAGALMGSAVSESPLGEVAAGA
ncbi:MAG: AarF/UbiB family protein [Polyangiales bacterium]